MIKPGVINSISSPRLSSYMTFFGCATEQDCMHYYFWNQALASELYILLGTIEVCLRNKIHDALCVEVSSKINNGVIDHNFAWYDHIDFYEKKRNGTNKTDRNNNPIYNDTGIGFRKITHKGQRCLNRPPQVVVSKLEFGKWPYVLTAKWYLDGSNVDWVKVFPAIFPNFSNMALSYHDFIIERIKSTCKWRNRLAHLEPVWKFGAVVEKGTGKVLVEEPKNQDEVIKRLNREIRNALQLLSWLCTDTAEHYQSTSSYQNLLHLASIKGIREFSYT
ncbi:Abi family protein [Acinetobacter indicus]|uniref:Abi family protein n=1 Tax=Acinetobacter indicus TaxID=756892 RepID=UPI000CECC3B9|nr:Abi family protein [Acinetobacter indicus]